MGSLYASVQRHGELDTESRSARALAARFRPVTPASLRSLLYQMGPFEPKCHAFQFKNGEGGGWAITEADAPEIKARFVKAIDAIVEDELFLLRNALKSLPLPLTAAMIGAVVDSTRDTFAGAVAHLIAGAIPGRYGRCGGMAFAGLDLFLAGYPADARFGTSPPESGALREFIFHRLLDSLEDNAATFFQWTAELHVLPVLSRLGTAALGGLIGSVGGPLGTAIGAYIGGREDAFGLGGEKLLLARTVTSMDALRAKLELYPAWPIGLIYGESASPIDQHQILATDASKLGAGVWALRVWDNNHGNAADAWVVDLRDAKVTVSGVTKAVRGIICELYARAEPPAALTSGST
jgi:hypothetical protein